MQDVGCRVLGAGLNLCSDAKGTAPTRGPTHLSLFQTHTHTHTNTRVKGLGLGGEGVGLNLCSDAKGTAPTPSRVQGIWLGIWRGVGCCV